MLTNTNTKYSEEAMRDDWDARLKNAQHCAFKHRHAAVVNEPDTAKRAALWAQIDAPRKIWFNAELDSLLERSVTEQAQLVINCLDDVRERARRPLAPQLPFLPRSILASAALAPYLERWRCAPSAETCSAHCAYPLLD
jgi:hypothetical protein